MKFYFWWMAISTNWRKKLLIHNINLTGQKKVHVAYGSWSSWRHKSSLFFSIEGPRFFLRVAVTMISKCFVKLGKSLYYKYSRKYEVKMKLKFIVYLYFEKSPEKRVVKIKNILESSLKLTFRQSDYRKWGFAIQCQI